METISLTGNINNFSPDNVQVDQENLQENQHDTPSIDIPALPEPVRNERSLSKDSIITIRKLRQYAKTFPAELAEHDLSNLQSKSQEELQALLTEVQYTVSSARSAHACRSMFLGTVQIGESIGPYIGMDLRGLAGVCSKSQDVLLTVDEIAIKYGNCIEIDPIHRLAASMIQLIIAVDTHNKSVRPLPTTQEKQEVSPETRESFKDL